MMNSSFSIGRGYLKNLSKLTRAVIEMSFIALIRPYIRFFYLFGQTLYPLNHTLRDKKDKRSKWHQMTLVLPTMVMFAINLTLCFATLTLININAGPVVKSVYISVNILLLCELIKIFAIVHQNVAYEESMREMIRNFQCVELLFRSILQRPIMFASFKRAYTRRLFWAFGSFIMLIVFVAIHHYLYRQSTLSDVMLETMKFISIVVYMHVLLYIDLLAFYLKHLNKSIARETGIYNADIEFVFLVKKVHTADLICELLFKYEMIYFRIWNIAEQLNEYFGWTVLVLTMRSFVELVIFTKWPLRLLNDYWSFIRLIRK